MQRVELSFYSDPLHCPFCGLLVLPEEEAAIPCPHTLYIANDEGGFEYVSDRLDFDTDVTLSEDEDYDGFTDKIEFPESLKIAICAPAPTFFRTYVGFTGLSK